MNWAWYAVLSAFFGALVAIFGKIGVKGVDSNLAVAFRTAIIVFFAWGIVAVQGNASDLFKISRHSLLFLFLSAIATGLSWLFYYKALQLGEASRVAPIDKLSVALAVTMAFIFLGEKPHLGNVLGAGLIMTGHAVLTPMLQAISMFAGDFVSMARTADRATPSAHPNAWHMRNLTLAAIPLAFGKLLFCIAVLAVGAFAIGLSAGQLQTLTLIMLVFATQGLIYILRERGPLWRSCPSPLMMLFSLADIAVISFLATSGTLMRPLPLAVVVATLAVTVVFILLLDRVKIAILSRWQID